MPELPEVETVRRGLERLVVGRTLRSVSLEHPRVARRHEGGAADLERRLSGRRITSACRRGKYLWLPLETPGGSSSGEALVVHLGMSGQMLVGGAGDGRHVRARFGFADGGPALRFVDQRTFGGLALDVLIEDVPSTVRHIARDPLDHAFDDGAFATALRTRRTVVKRAMLDQTLVSGIGNIYADEALWRSRLHGRVPVTELSQNRALRLIADVRDVLADALAAGGTTFDSLYVNVNGASGSFEGSLQAYGRHGRPCSRCGTPVQREAFMNRSSFFCPACQPPPS